MNTREMNLRDSQKDLVFWERFIKTAKKKDHIRMAQSSIKFAKSQIEYWGR